MSSRIPSNKLTAIKIAGLYAIVGGLWILSGKGPAFASTCPPLKKAFGALRQKQRK